MPRKPKPPPFPELRIEGLSVQPKPVDTFLCDFDGTVKPLKPEAIVKPRPSIHTMSPTAWEKHKREERKAYELEIVRRYVAQRDKAHEIIHNMLNPPKVEPKPASNQVFTAGGLVITVPRNPNALKRRL